MDEDGWADLPGYSRGVLRPRLFWNGGNGRTFFATVGVTLRSASGGTMRDAVLPAIGHAYARRSRRDGWTRAPSARCWSERYVLSARGAVDAAAARSSVRRGASNAIGTRRPSVR